MLPMKTYPTDVRYLARMSEPSGPSGPVFWKDTDDTEALRRYRSLVNSVGDGIYQLDIEGQFVAVTDSLVELTGYRREELLGEHVSLLLNDDSTIEPALTNPIDQTKQLTFTIQTANEDQVRCDVRINPLESNGTLQGTVGIIQEITERKRLNQSLKESDQRHNRDPTNEWQRSLHETKFPSISLGQTGEG